MARYDAGGLIEFAAQLLQRAGLDAPKCRPVAEVLVEADLMGHDTHGLAQLPDYIAALESGAMVGTGDAAVISDLGAVTVWDGGWRSGVWLTRQALEVAAGRARQFGIGAVSIARSHHIACLQAYLPPLTQQGLMAIITCSDPSVATVAPAGGRDGVLSPDPIAVGIPTDADPILVDISASITTNAMANRYAIRGERMPGAWLQDAQGMATDDPAVLKAEPRGALLPTGGQDHGHKGFGLALMIEALTQGLSGYGRAGAEARWGASVFVLVLDPAAFAGRAAYERQTTAIADLCLASQPIRPDRPVRLPGRAAIGRTMDARASGVTLAGELVDRLAQSAARHGLAVPSAIA